MRKKLSVFDILNSLLMLMILFVTLYPIIYIISVSFSDTIFILKNEITLFPKGFNVKAYVMVLKDIRIPRAYLNTIIYTCFGAFINLLMTAVAAYPLSRKGMFGRNIILRMIVFTMFFSGGMIPSYILVQKLGMIDTIWALCVPNAIWTFELLILKSFYESFEESIRESAIIEGASEFRILFQIIIPLSKAALASIALFYFMGHWNSFFLPMIYLNDAKKLPLQVILRDMLIESSVKQHSSTSEEIRKLTPEALKNATIFISMVPALAMYPFVQKYFTTGIMVGAVKG